MNTYRVIKRNKRLWVQCLETGKCLYTPPDFLRPHMRDRKRMIQLANELTSGISYIKAVIDFESCTGCK